MDAFYYGMGSPLVDTIEEAATLTPAPYDFCISNIRPILAGAPSAAR